MFAAAAADQLLVESYFSVQTTLPTNYFIGLSRPDQPTPYTYVTRQNVSQTPVNTLLYAHWCWTFNPAATYNGYYIYHCVSASSSCKYDGWVARLP